jgi:hypothetical protein
VLALVHDDALRICVDPSVSPHVDAWLPFSATPSRCVTPASTVSVQSVQALPTKARLTDDTPERTPVVSPPSGATPTLRLGGVDAYLDDTTQSVLLRSDSGHVAGYVNLSAGDAWIDIVESTVPRRDGDVSSALTLCTALLMNRLERTLVHAAAVAPPGGAAWLLVGDTHAGKTTTTATLMAAGWEYLSDDHVVLSATERGPMVEGWPRTFHLDAGWRTGAPMRSRIDVDPRQLALSRWRTTAVLGGILFPSVVANAPTHLEPMSAAQALTGLVRQSPWLMADARAAPSALALLTAAAQLPVRRLCLGFDTFNQPAALAHCLAPLCLTPPPGDTMDVPGVLRGESSNQG